MSLVKERKLRNRQNAKESGVGEEGDVDGGNAATKTILEALERFETCRAVVDSVIDLRDKKSLEVSFDKLATFQTKLDNCQVSSLTPKR